MSVGGNITQTSSSLWTAALTAPVSTGRSRTRIKKSEIVHYSEFMSASATTDDLFWKSILESCSRKKFPRGFVYENGVLSHRGNDISIALPNNSYDLASTAIYFFQENGKLYSKKDRKRRKQIEEEAILKELTEKNENWTCVSRSKNRRSTHVKDYVERKYKYLSKNIRDDVFTQINIGFETRYLTKNHVLFENGQIINIDGIDGTQNGLVFTRHYPNKRFVLSQHVADKPKEYRHYDIWCKWLEDYNKNMKQATRSSHTVQSARTSSSNFT